MCKSSSRTRLFQTRGQRKIIFCDSIRCVVILCMHRKRPMQKERRRVRCAYVMSIMCEMSIFAFVCVCVCKIMCVRQDGKCVCAHDSKVVRAGAFSSTYKRWGSNGESSLFNCPLLLVEVKITSLVVHLQFNTTNKNRQVTSNKIFNEK